MAFQPDTDLKPVSPLNSGWIDHYFGIKAKNSTFFRESMAGISTFLALSYIFVVNPAILSNAGMDRSAVLFATITTSAIATLLMGLWARLPFVVAPGMEMNAYVAFFVIGALGFSWQQALGIVFWSSVIMVLATIAPIREKIIDCIPDAMKVGLAFSIGVFLILIALNISGVLVYEGVTLKSVGTLFDGKAYALLLGLALILVFDLLRVPGSVLIAIILTSFYCHKMGMAKEVSDPVELSSRMLAAIGALDLWVLLDPKSISVLVVLFVLDFYGSIAKFIGLTLNTNILENGNVPRRKQALLVDGACSTLGAALGTTSMIAYVESAVGIGMGARTGLAAVVCALLMLGCFLAAPFLHYVPITATTGALVYVGIRLCPGLDHLRRLSAVDLLVLAIMPLCVIATFAIDRAMLAGFTVYLVSALFAKRRVNVFLVGSVLLLATGLVLQNI